ncbi:MAG: hypothetical protein RLN81_09830 [Balneolaceae bacterium]
MKVIATIIGILFLSNAYVQAQECSTEPPNGLGELAAYSIFQGNYSGGDYPFALTYGRWMLCKKSKEMEGNPRFNLATQYNKFIKMYTEIGLTKEDPSEREAYIDTALSLFDESFELFTDEELDKYDLRQRKGRYFLENYSYIEDGLAKAYAEFETMFELDPQRTTELGSGYYIRVTVDNMAKKGRKEEVLKMMETATPFASDEILSFFDETKVSLFDTPEERIEYYDSILADDPNNIEALNFLAEAYDDLDMQTELIETLRKIHELAPTFDSAMSLAEVEQGNAQYAEAAVFYKEALEKAESDQDKKEINIDLADVYTSLNELATAKRYISAAIAIDANYGLAYVKMASIYGQAVSSCTEDRKLEAKDKVVYWVVVDYLNKAKRVDSSVSNTVNSQLSTYEAVTPSTEDKFFTLSYEDGQKVTVDGSLMSCYSWINETTTVR